MSRERPSQPPAVSRRAFLALGAAAAGALAVPRRPRAGTRVVSPDDLDRLSPFERLHAPVLRLPAVTTNGHAVPIVVEMTHPMEADHHITRVHVVNPRDPVPSKGVVHFTPASGQAYLAFQARIDHGVSEVLATAECNRHGPWTSTRTVTIPDGAGGCAASAPTAAGAIRPPVVRIPRLARREPIRRGEIIDVQVTMGHPNRTGLAVRGDGRWVQVSEPFHLTELEVFHGSERVSWFAPTSALSDNPFITVRLRVRGPDPIRVVLANTRGERFEAAHDLPLS